MLKFIFRRIAQSIPIILVISILCFALMKMAPYDTIDALTTPTMSPELVEIIKEKNGLNKPPTVQYLRWVSNVMKGDLGYSIVTRTSITDSLIARLPNTLILVLPAYILATIIAIILGLVAGFRHNKLFDRIIDGLTTIGISTPLFWLAMVCIYIFSYKFNWFPIQGMHTLGKENSFIDLLWHLCLPIFILTIAFVPEQFKYIRSSTISQLKEDYVMVQMAYGAKSSQILFRHVIKNVLLPVITLFGMSLPLLITGAFVTESMFSWPGVGPYFLQGILGLDYPVVLSVLLLSSTMVVIGNLFADILYCIVDPRIQNYK